MPRSKKAFKIPPKKYQPKGLSVLYEDHDILVVDKTNGLLTVSTDKIKEDTAYYHLTDYVKKGVQKSTNRVFIVHRLDRDTSGILVFAKNEYSKRFLQDEWHEFKKKYYAVVHGTLSDTEGIITSYLVENRAYRMYSVKDPEKGKLAKTGYKVLKESKKYSLLEIDLLTGRKNQIRVHFAEKGFPVVGDKMYGDKEKNKGIKRLALHSTSLTILHPVTKEKMTFETDLPDYFKSLMKK
ncbi:RNA pseudouridine synthase [Desulforhopalus vacuolatus]|uniref:RluA family pseudouridine synthase n=1 Tax=Desulforhopalus vacuolatus TaxID=40414 RepID=UPI001962892B|nr:RNA pseudouridine synthase [Desulforhopalus vacuolatus]MBM9519650.1 RNA pseudouridine synthase [Desulforhopalus vacuolatus]